MHSIRSQMMLLLSLFLLPICGCEFPGIIAAKTFPGEMIRPKYIGLAGQSIGVMVWTDRGAQVDYPALGLDLANSIQKKLIDDSKKDELKAAYFPVQPASIARYQVDHPTYDFKNVTEIAPKLGVTRLIYIEIEDFSTRAPASVELFRGSMSATLKVVEVDGGHARVAYEENAIKAVFPPKVQPDGTPDGDDIRFYAGTVDAMSTEIGHHLVSYEAEP